MRKLSLAIGAMVLIGIAQQTYAAPIVFSAPMSGLNEVPPNASPATGFTTVTLNGNLLTVDVTFNGLTGGAASAGHIHCCTAPGTNIGVAVGYPLFPNSTSGIYNSIFDLTLASVYTANFLNNFGGGTAAGAQAALINGFFAGTAYSNIHNSAFPGGEIRGNLVFVPEPLTLYLFGVGVAGVALARRRRMRAA